MYKLFRAEGYYYDQNDQLSELHANESSILLFNNAGVSRVRYEPFTAVENIVQLIVDVGSQPFAGRWAGEPASWSRHWCLGR